MSYTTGIPTNGQSLGNSRPQVQGNFDYINTSNSVNHVAFNSSGFGKHKFLQMPEQGSAPATAANEGGLYTKESQSITNLFWRQESSGTQIQMTNIAPTNSQKGSTFLPGGLLLQWDFVTIGASGSATTVTLLEQFTKAGVNFDPYVVMVTPSASAASITGLSLGTRNFVAASKQFDITRFGGIGATIDVMYLSLGPKT